MKKFLQLTKWRNLSNSFLEKDYILIQKNNITCLLWKLVWIVETYCIPICIYMLRFTIFHLSFFFHWKEFINCKNYWIMCFQGREQSLYESRVNAITTRRSANKEDLQEICKHERSKRAAPLIFPRTIRIRNARWTERLPDRSYKN